MKIKKIVVISWLFLVFVLTCSSIYAAFTDKSALAETLAPIAVVIGIIGGLLLFIGDFFKE